MMDQLHGLLKAAGAQVPNDPALWRDNLLWQHESQDHRVLVGVADAALTRVTKLEEALKYIRDNYDCDKDAHRYDTPCRSCTAAAALAE